jgi:hypothetical protein
MTGTWSRSGFPPRSVRAPLNPREPYAEELLYNQNVFRQVMGEYVRRVEHEKAAKEEAEAEGGYLVLEDEEVRGLLREEEADAAAAVAAAADGPEVPAPEEGEEGKRAWACAPSLSRPMSRPVSRASSRLLTSREYSYIAGGPVNERTLRRLHQERMRANEERERRSREIHASKALPMTARNVLQKHGIKGRGLPPQPRVKRARRPLIKRPQIEPSFLMPEGKCRDWAFRSLPGTFPGQVDPDALLAAPFLSRAVSQQLTFPRMAVVKPDGCEAPRPHTSGSSRKGARSARETYRVSPSSLLISSG